MDSQLADRLNALNDQNDALRKTEEAFLRLDAEKKALLAKLTTKADGKSHSEREANALASQDWADFSLGLALTESEYQFDKRRFAILEKAYLAEHASFTREARLITRQGIMT